MSIPAYLFLTDENNSPIIGGSLVSGRVGAIELKSFAHHLSIPCCGHTGRLTGTRVHEPINIQKEFDKVTPLLYRALTNNLVLKSATIKMYQIMDSGMEHEYFNILLENVKITAITPTLLLAAQRERIWKTFSYVMRRLPGSTATVISYTKINGMRGPQRSIACQSSSLVSWTGS